MPSIATNPPNDTSFNALSHTSETTQDLAFKLALRESDIILLHKTLQTFPTIESARIFGSRGRGTARQNTDIDIAIFGHNATMETTQQLRFYLEENTILPYKFDILHFESLTNPALQANILADGQIIFEQNS